jgi:MHS family proline/betaine transporter-like MFS transporter
VALHFMKETAGKPLSDAPPIKGAKPVEEDYVI